MRSFIVSLGILLIASTNLLAQDGLAKSIKLIDEMQFNAAVVSLNQLPTSVEKEYQLGKAFLYLAQSDSATAHFNKAAQIEPKSIYTNLSLGAVEILRKNNDTSENYLNKALKQAKKSGELIAEVALISVIGPVKNFAMATQAIERGKEVTTRSSALYIAIGDVELARGEYGNALNAYEWATTYDNTNPVSFRKIGNIQTLARDYKNGVVSLKKSIELNPEQILVYKNLSDLQFLFGKYAESLTNYETYLSKIKPTIDDRERYSLILFFNKKYDESSKQMDVVLAENPGTPVLFRIRGYSAFETGDYQKGVEAMAKFFELQKPEKIIISDYIYYGKLNEKVKNDSLAIVYLKKSTVADSSKNDLFDLLAQVYSRSHKHLDAIGCYNQMIKNGQPQANGLYSIGKEYLYMGAYLKNIGDSLMKKNVTNDYLDKAKVAFQGADSTFSMLNTVLPSYIKGYMLRAQALVYLDPESKLWLAKPVYEQVAGMMEADPAKNKRNLIEAYKYLAAYHFMCYFRDYKTDKNAAAVSRQNTISYNEKIVALDPSDTNAKESLALLLKK
ncbi:MAG: tetratricopeptide repeat protein [Bacteroidales bacterium]